jgi:hypothetical protein
MDRKTSHHGLAEYCENDHIAGKQWLQIQGNPHKKIPLFFIEIGKQS